MKILIRHPATGLFRNEDGTWTKGWEHAQHFESSVICIDFCSAHNLPAYEVLMKHPDNDDRDIVVFSHNLAPVDSRLHFFGHASGGSS